MCLKIMSTSTKLHIGSIEVYWNIEQHLVFMPVYHYAIMPVTTIRTDNQTANLFVKTE